MYATICIGLNIVGERDILRIFKHYISFLEIGFQNLYTQTKDILSIKNVTLQQNNSKLKYNNVYKRMFWVLAA